MTKCHDGTDLPVIVAPKDRVWCGGVEGRTHKRSTGGLCEACNDYRPDWSWERPTLATAFDDGRRYGIQRGRKEERERIRALVREALIRGESGTIVDMIDAERA